MAQHGARRKLVTAISETSDEQERNHMTIRVTHYGMDGEGRTVKEAKADAGRKVEVALREARHGVCLVASNGYAAIVAYDVSQAEWGYRLINSAGPGQFSAGPQWVTCYGERDAARRAALRHMVEIAWSHAVDDQQFVDDALAGRDHGCPMTHSDRLTMRNDLLDRFAWQRRYRKAADAGWSDDAAHKIAGNCGHLVTGYEKAAA
jgi:hypothetical protein